MDLSAAALGYLSLSFELDHHTNYLESGVRRSLCKLLPFNFLTGSALLGVCSIGLGFLIIGLALDAIPKSSEDRGATRKALIPAEGITTELAALYFLFLLSRMSDAGKLVLAGPPPVR